MRSIKNYKLKLSLTLIALSSLLGLSCSLLYTVEERQFGLAELIPIDAKCIIRVDTVVSPLGTLKVVKYRERKRLEDR